MARLDNFAEQEQRKFLSRMDPRHAGALLLRNPYCGAELSMS
jgi:hypothetical protein